MNDEPNNLIGFLTIVSTPDLGHCGGLLVVNRLGRPIEFHCTSPVVENRTQKILYGQTYAQFLFADQIGEALIEKTRKKFSLLVTDKPELALISSRHEFPVGVLAFNDSDDCANEFTPTTPDSRIEIQSQVISLFGVDSRLSEAAESCRGLGNVIPLDEPFERIRQAIGEAISIARPATREAA